MRGLLKALWDRAYVVVLSLFALGLLLLVVHGCLFLGFGRAGARRLADRLSGVPFCAVFLAVQAGVLVLVRARWGLPVLVGVGGFVLGTRFDAGARGRDVAAAIRRAFVFGCAVGGMWSGVSILLNTPWPLDPTRR